MYRRLRRFYVESALKAEDTLFQLSTRETFHLHRVLRLKAGDVCQIFNREGQRAQAIVESLSETEGARLRLTQVFPLKQTSLYLKVAQALPQKGKVDNLVEKAEELGVQELWLLETERSIVKMKKEAEERAKSRWERIVVEAAKQSGSPTLLRIEGPFSFEKVMKEKLNPSEEAFLFHPDPSGLAFPKLVERLKNRKGPLPSSIFLFFGPEGGFAHDEVSLAESSGVQKVFLGDSTLRLETAFLGVISALRFLLMHEGDSEAS